MADEDCLRSLDARVAQLKIAVERMTRAQLKSVEWCSQTVSDVGDIKAEIIEMRREVAGISKALVAVYGKHVKAEKALKTTSTYPISSGYFDAEITEMYQSGATDRDIARALGCHPMTVSRRRQAIGVEGWRRDAHWTPREEEILRRRCAEYSTWADVARGIEGRGEQACRSHGKRLGLALRPAWRPWTEDEHEYLRENWESGTPTDEICARLGRSEKAVRQRAHELGLTQSGKRNRIALDRSAERFWARGGVT